jgi:hypothetical protein
VDKCVSLSAEGRSGSNRGWKGMADNKEKYIEWGHSTYIPIYSKPWWMDAVCGRDNWDVWLYYSGNEILAAMPYYLEERNGYKYITKAPLTQNNGIIFIEGKDRKKATQLGFEEKVIDEACRYINTLGLGVYEQQYQTTFHNWIPFMWHGYSVIPRISFIIEDTKNYDTVYNNYTVNRRRKVRKGRESIHRLVDVDKKIFYNEHKKIFEKQGLSCPFSYELWDRLHEACTKHNACKIIASEDEKKRIMSLIFLVFDEQCVYFLLGGNIPEFSSLETYSALMDEGIKMAGEKGLRFDFEGSVIKRIYHTYKEFGGVPRTYYRIRKVFEPEILKREQELQIKNLEMTK